MSIEKLEVTFVKVKLDDASGGMLSDPANYLTMKHGSTDWKSKTVYGQGKLPKFDEKIEINLKNGGFFKVSIHNEGTFSDDLLATCTVMLDQMKT